MTKIWCRCACMRLFRAHHSRKVATWPRPAGPNTWCWMMWASTGVPSRRRQQEGKLMPMDDVTACSDTQRGAVPANRRNAEAAHRRLWRSCASAVAFGQVHHLQWCNVTRPGAKHVMLECQHEGVDKRQWWHVVITPMCTSSCMWMKGVSTQTHPRPRGSCHFS